MKDVSNPVLAALQCLLLFAGVGCQAPTPAMKFIKQADRLHNEALASTLIVDTDLNDYLQLVADRIAGAAKTAAPGKVDAAFLARVRCQLVASDTINAFSTGGTHVYVTNGLFQQCQSEEELAAAIAHAYAHLINLDLESTKMEPDAGIPLSMVAWQYVINRFTREQERRADALALALYAKAGWDPSHFAVLFEHMEAISGGNVAPDRESLPARAFVLQTAAGDARKAAPQLPVADAETFISLRQKAAGFHEPAVAGAPQIYIRAFPNCILSGDAPEQQKAQQQLKPLPPPPHVIEPS